MNAHPSQESEPGERGVSLEQRLEVARLLPAIVPKGFLPSAGIVCVRNSARCCRLLLGHVIMTSHKSSLWWGAS